jgi:hypothetical protein
MRGVLGVTLWTGNFFEKTVGIKINFSDRGSLSFFANSFLRGVLRVTLWAGNFCEKNLFDRQKYHFYFSENRF